jgi:tRNA threonylcarbamoyladenosine biosynthesis protein TsaE
VLARERETASAEETEALGALLGRTAEAGALIGLVGELGSGKTCFVRGLAAGLGIDPARVSSPTFVLVHEYGGGRLPLHHVDLYRLERPEVEEPLLREVLYGTGVAAVEWFDRLPPSAAADALRVTLSGSGERRTVRLEARGPRHEGWLARALG